MKNVISDAFEWDAGKDDANIQKHGISFARAAGIFERPYLRLQTAYESEARWIALGETDGEIIAVIYTQRASRVRIISARMARKHEREIYRDRISDRT